MNKILYVNACVRPESRTNRLAQPVLKHLSGVVEEVSLQKERIVPLDYQALQKREVYQKQKDFSDPMFRYAKQFAGADEIVIAAPYWDLSFPSILKVYLEALTVTGLTFRYTPEGYPEGLCKADRLFYITTAGGPIGQLDLGYSYVKALAETLFGISKTISFRAESLDIWGNDAEAILKEAQRKIEESDIDW